MNVLFVFFVLPLVTILLAIVLQKILRNPILVGITFFAIFLIVAFVAFSTNIAAAIIGAIILSIIAYITAIIVELICLLRQRFCEVISVKSLRNKCSCNNENNGTQNISDSGNLLRISCNCQNGESSDLLTINSNCNINNDNNNESDNSGCSGCNNPRDGFFIDSNVTSNGIINNRKNCYNRSYYRRF